MKTRFVVSSLAAAFLVVLSAAGPAMASESVSIGDNFYSPKSITITAGTTVVWSYPSSGQTIHTVTADDGSFDSSPNCPGDLSSCMQPGDSYSHTFNSTGTFDYQCKIHGAAMSGTVVVQAASTSPGPTTPGQTTSGSPLPNTGPGSTTGPFLVFGMLFLLAGGFLLYRLRRRA